MKTETTADLNVLHEQRSKTATEEHERLVEGNKHVVVCSVLTREGREGAKNADARHGGRD